MQQTYVTQSSSGSSPWKLTNTARTGQFQMTLAIASAGVPWQIDVTADDPTGRFPFLEPGPSAGVRIEPGRRTDGRRRRRHRDDHSAHHGVAADRERLRGGIRRREVLSESRMGEICMSGS
jgi:hypothetical protein